MRDSITQLEIRSVEHRAIQAEVNRLAGLARDLRLAGGDLASAVEGLCEQHPELRVLLTAWLAVSGGS